MRLKSRLVEGALSEGISLVVLKVLMRLPEFRGETLDALDLKRIEADLARGVKKLMPKLRGKALDLGSYRYWPVSDAGTVWVASDGGRIRSKGPLEFIADYAEEYRRQDIFEQLLDGNVEALSHYIVARRDQAGHEGEHLGYY